MFVLIAVFDTFVEQISSIASMFLGLAALPWLMGLFDKVTLPGGVELNLRDIGDKLDSQSPVSDAQDGQAFKCLELHDPNLALVALRIEIEKRLRKIADTRALDDKHTNRGIRSLVLELEKRGDISREVSSVINDMMPALNAAAHGAEVPRESGTWVKSNGPRLLSLLDDKY